MHLVDHGFVRAIYNNLYDLGGGMFRSSQPSQAQIRKYHRKYGLKTIINLRGEHDYGSYFFEREVCEELGIVLHSVKLYSRNPPEVAEVRMMRELFERIEYPALMHCKSACRPRRNRRGAVSHPASGRAGIAGDEGTRLEVRPLQEGQDRGAGFLFRPVSRRQREEDRLHQMVETDYDDKALKAQFREDRWSSLVVDKVLHRE